MTKDQEQEERPKASSSSSSADCESDGWETDEETLVHVHISGVFQEDLCKQKQAKFIGLDSEEPVVQLGNQVFAGKYQDIVGTALFFEEKKDKEEENRSDPVFENPDKKVDLKYKCKTNRRLVLKRVFLKEKAMNK